MSVINLVKDIQLRFSCLLHTIKSLEDIVRRASHGCM